MLEHIEAQTTSCLFTKDGRPAVDFLGRSERFDEDFQASWSWWGRCLQALAQHPSATAVKGNVEKTPSRGSLRTGACGRR